MVKTAGSLRSNQLAEHSEIRRVVRRKSGSGAGRMNSLAAPSFSAESSATKPELLVQVIKINLKKDPKGLAEGLADVIDNDTVVAVAKTVGAIYGVPPTAIDCARIAAKAVKLKRKGDEYYPSWTPPAGYFFCNASLKRARSYIGTGAFSAAVRPNLLYAYIWLKEKSFGRGRSLLDVEMTVVCVKKEFQQKYRDLGMCVGDKRVYAVVARWSHSRVHYQKRRKLADRFPT